MRHVFVTFIKYCGVGGISTLFHYLTFFLTLYLLDWLPWRATLLGASLGALMAYFLNYHYTFANKNKHRKILPVFIAVASLGAIIQTLTMILLNTQWQWHYLLSQLVATLIGLITTFIMNRFWTFR